VQTAARGKDRPAGQEDAPVRRFAALFEAAPVCAGRASCLGIGYALWMRA
jgi:hypothetical protein